MTIVSSIHFLCAALVVASDFVVTFTDAQSLEKWALDIPVSSYDSQANTLTLTFDVDDSIAQANTAATVWDPDCREGGNQLLAADGIEGIAIDTDTTGKAALSFDLDYSILKQKSNVFTDLPAQSTASVQFCARFMLYTDDGSTEVNFLESIITIDFDLTSSFATNIDVQKRAIGVFDFDEDYVVDAYLCDPDYPSVPLTGLTFQQGDTIHVCVTPATEALMDDIRLRSIDSFDWIKGNIAIQSAINSNAPSNILTTIRCIPDSIYCIISTLLKADFYRTTDAPSNAPTTAPTNAPTICDGVASSSETELDFLNSILTQNDLQHGGELRYGNIGNVSGTPVDLVITSTGYVNSNARNNGRDARQQHIRENQCSNSAGRPRIRKGHV